MYLIKRTENLDMKSPRAQNMLLGLFILDCKELVWMSALDTI